MLREPAELVLPDLDKYLSDPKKGYKGENSQRHSFIALYRPIARRVWGDRHLPREQKLAILWGLALLQWKMIKIEYQRMPSFWSPMHSTMFSLLQEHLDLANLPHIKALYYLAQCREYLNALAIEPNAGSYWRDKNHLLEDVDAVVQYSLDTHRAEAENLLHATPELAALQLQIKGMLESYNSEFSWIDYPDDKKCIDPLNFLRIIFLSCDRLRHCEDPVGMNELRKKEHRILTAVMLFTMLHIKNGRWISPENGWILNGCPVFLSCAEKLNDHKRYPNEEKARCYDTLLDYMADLKKDKTFYDLVAQEWKRRGLNLELFWQTSQTEISTEIKRLQAPPVQSLPRRALSSTATFLTQCSLSTVVQTLAGAQIQAAFTQTAIVAAAVCDPATVALIVGGKLLTLAAGYAVTTDAAATALNGVYTYVIDTVSSTIGGSVTDAVVTAASQAEKFAVLRSEFDAETDLWLRRYAETMVALPDKFVSPAVKAQIKVVLPFEGEKCIPYVATPKIKLPRHHVKVARAAGAEDRPPATERERDMRDAMGGRLFDDTPLRTVVVPSAPEASVEEAMAASLYRSSAAGKAPADETGADFVVVPREVAVEEPVVAFGRFGR